MTFTKAKYLVTTCILSTSIIICPLLYASELGEKNSPDVIGEPGTRKEVHDSKRESKKPTGPTKVTDNGDSRPEKKPLNSSVAPPPTNPPSPADVKRQDNLVIQNAEERIKKDEKKEAIVAAFVEALSADPKETPSKATEAVVTALLDAVGLCSVCDSERKAAQNYLSKIIEEEAKKRLDAKK